MRRVQITCCRNVKPPPLPCIQVTSSVDPQMESYIRCHHGLLLSYDKNGTTVFGTSSLVSHNHKDALAPVHHQVCCCPKTEIALQVKVTLCQTGKH